MNSTKQLLNTGTATALLFWVSTFIGGYIHGNYNHLRDTISALGAIGSKSQSFMAVTTALCAAFSLVFMSAMISTCKKTGINILPAVSIICIPVMFAWAAIFPSGNPLHPVLGSVILVLYLGAISSLFLWRGQALRQMRMVSLFSIVAMMLLLLRLIPFFQNNCPGLIQRFAHLGWSVWFIGLNISFAKLIDKGYQQQHNKNSKNN